TSRFSNGSRRPLASYFGAAAGGSATAALGADCGADDGAAAGFGAIGGCAPGVALPPPQPPRPAATAGVTEENPRLLFSPPGCPGFGAGGEPTGRYWYVASTRSARSGFRLLETPAIFISCTVTTRGMLATRSKNSPSWWYPPSAASVMGIST